MTRVIGLTGGIASGKSTVGRILRELGAPIIDADQLARDVVEPGTPALAAIVDRFGQGILDQHGRLDRAQLGSIVFGDDDARKALNAIIHPRIAEASQKAIAAQVAAGAKAVVYEAALLVENNAYGWMHALIVVSLPPVIQRARVMQRDDITADEADARLRSQLPLADKVAVADHVIDNSGTLEETRRQTEEVWAKVNADG